MTIPETLHHLFWDVDPSHLTTDHARFIIERVLDWGDIQAMNWLLKTFPRDTIVNALRTSRRLALGLCFRQAACSSAISLAHM